MTVLSIEHQMRRAESLIQKGRVDDAKSLYEELLKKFPKNQKAQKRLANLIRKKEEIQSSTEVERYNQLLISLHFEGRFEEMLDISKKATQENPNSILGWFYYGAAHRALGNSEAALSAFKRVIEINPTFSDGHTNLGAVFQDRNEFGIAIECYKTAICLKDNNAKAFNNLGTAYKAKGDLKNSIEAYKKAISIEPQFAVAHKNLGSALKDVGLNSEAKRAYKIALSLRPNDEEIEYMIACLVGEKLQTAPRRYVEKLFDGYATRFEQALVGQLDYKIPELISQLFNKEKGDELVESVLDLGCGTGLVGEKIRNKCKRLEGIDLSQNMVELAARKQVYDKVVKADIAEYLASTELDFDCFIAADVFVYLGDLAEVFCQIKSKNKRGGMLFFSTEHNEKEGFFLETSGRFSHSKSYVESLCVEFGYAISSFSKTRLRKEKETFLEGGLYILEF